MIRLLLVGAGHVHLEILRRIVLERPDDLEVTVVTLEARQFYFGMTPGYLAGQYTLADITSDVPAIARRAGAACVIGSAERLDPAARQVVLGDGRALTYDIVSFNIGSLPAGAGDEAAAHAEAIKPLHRARRVKERLDALVAGTGAEPVRIVVIGAGAGGVEVACAAAGLLDRAGRAREVTLVDRAGHILPGYAPRFQRRAAGALDALRIRRRLAVAAAAVTPERVELTEGTAIACDLAVRLTGPEAAPLLRASGLPADPRGFLWTDDSLRSTGDPRAFAVGDCGTLMSHPSTPKAGVYAVREAPILWRNLLATARRLPLATYEPQRGFLSILNTCDGRALLRYKGLVSWSRWAWWLKDRIDRRFMKRYRRVMEKVER
jgi:NADH dehydrogenase FAD-containing subunit